METDERAMAESEERNNKRLRRRSRTIREQNGDARDRVSAVNHSWSDCVRGARRRWEEVEKKGGLRLSGRGIEGKVRTRDERHLEKEREAPENRDKAGKMTNKREVALWW